MALLELVSPWDSQPQEAADIDWGGLAVPDIGVWMPPYGLRNGVSGSAVSPVGAGVTHEPATGGVAWAVSGQSLSGSSSGRLDTGNTEVPTQLWFVVQIVSFDAPSASGYGSPFHRDQYAINWHHGSSSYRGAVTLNCGGAYPRVMLLDAAANKLHTVVASWDGSTLTVWQNGALCGSVAASGSLGSNPLPLSLLGSSSGASFNGQMFLSAMGRHNIASAVGQALSANPWQIFQRREWVPFTASSGGSVTGASSGTLALTGAAAGSVLVTGASAGTLTLSGSATGTVGATGVTGASAGTLALTGTSTGTVRVTGASAGALGLTGSATGSARVSGASAGTLSLAGTATGNTTGAVSGASVGVLSLSGSATGSVRVSGGSAAVLQITRTASAQIIVRGVSAGVLSMSGSATGTTGGAEPEPTTALARYTITAKARKTTIQAKARRMEIKA